MKRLPGWSLPSLVAIVVIGLWQAWVSLADVPTYLVPSPWRVAQTLWSDRALLGPAWWVTLKVTLMAFAAATVVGGLVAFVFVQNRWLEAALFPYAVLLQVTPIVAIAPLIIIWVKDPTAALVLCATLVAVFPVIANTTQGLRSVHPGLLDFFELRGASRWQTLWRLRLPSALPSIFTGLRIAAGLSLIGAVVAEFVAGTGGSASGLAYQILQSGYQLDIPRMFAALVLISLTGIALFALLTACTKLALSGWHESERRP
ncbi:MAG: ABC transporter permease [Burkholderiales bacterium]|nr:ABC transporter permease [Burkholderiales bacterium]MBH2016313.1 ABC transporter permease [Burkholderiales bacterium]